MDNNNSKNRNTVHTNFDYKGTNVPTQPKVPPMPAPKPNNPQK